MPRKRAGGRAQAFVALVASILVAGVPGRIARGAQDETAAFSLAGMARLESGAPVADASVSIIETGDNLFSAFVKTSPDGSFAAAVPRGTYSVTLFSETSSRTPTDLLDTAVRGISVDGDVALDLTVRRGTAVQTSVVSATGVPLAGARIDVFDETNEVVRTAFTDSSGWARFVATTGQCVFVTPPQQPGLDIGRWVRFEELGVDASGIARPIRLDALDAPADTGATVIPLLRGRAAGRHVRIALVSEGFTADDEPFVDKNGNGVCDNEPYLDIDGNGRFSSADRYVDANGNGRRDREPFTDLNGDGICNRGERALFVQSAMDNLRLMLAFPVYREMRESLDVDAVFVASRQAGSDFPTLPVPVMRDTRFDSRFLSLNFIFSYDNDKLVADARMFVPTYDLLGMITYNVYGTGRESGGGTVALFASPRTELDFTAAHEFGHSLGRLADEYFAYDGAPPYAGLEPNYPNITRSSETGNLKWSRFVRSSTPVPTPDGTAGVGAFEGGYYRRHGILRPSYNCMMRKFGIFCPVCADAMVTQSFAVRGVERASRAQLSMPLEGDPVEGDTLVGIDVDDLSRVASVQPLVDRAPAGAPVTVAPFGALVDTRPFADGVHAISAEVTYADGSVETTPPVEVTISHASVSTPMVGGARFASGTLVLRDAAGVVVPGAVVFVGGVDRFPLELAQDGAIRVVKTALGSASNMLFRKVLRPGRTVQIVVVNPDGGRTAPIDVVR